jgi:hypothetical protein
MLCHKIVHAAPVGVFADQQQRVIGGQLGEHEPHGLCEFTLFEPRGGITIPDGDGRHDVRILVHGLSVCFSTMLPSLPMGDAEQPTPQRTTARVIRPGGLSRGEECFLYDIGDASLVAADESGDVPPHAFAVMFEQQRPRLSVAGLQPASDGVLVPGLSQARSAEKGNQAPPRDWQ